MAVYGASGYTGRELLRLLARHEGVEVTALVTRQAEPLPLSEVHPSLGDAFDLRLEPLVPSQVAERADAAFTCLPHAASAEVVSQLLDAGLRVVDLSADYRLDDRSVYESWYGVTHPDAGRIGSVPYGLP
ncbi:MAG: N-acetyl-gamma-glutamyl-phosphate reductase, partial [Planctomycetota bacterium]